MFLRFTLRELSEQKVHVYDVVRLSEGINTTMSEDTLAKRNMHMNDDIHSYT